ncbi:MAG: formylglycine-generating enzyme family protein [Chloroflexi bacterium]|nr:formylglycine-generating enzyme family protein [Chloroflexota bacterium]
MSCRRWSKSVWQVLGLALCVALIGRGLAGAGQTHARSPHTLTPTPGPDVRAIAGVPFVYVPAGCFMIGSADGDPDELPRREVCLSAYWIGQTEVTNAQYRRCVGAGVCAPPHDQTFYDDPAYADHPVVFVDWFQAEAFAAWIGGGLPTEAQWEYAARGPESRDYPWGENFDGTRLNWCDSACGYGWRASGWDDGYSGTAPVGSYPDGASWVDALDMVGNVWEWTADAYDPDYYATLPDGALDPVSAATVEWRTVRGGSYASSRQYVRAASRDWDSPNLRFVVMGFRVVREDMPG